MQAQLLPGLFIKRGNVVDAKRSAAQLSALLGIASDAPTFKVQENPDPFNDIID